MSRHTRKNTTHEISFGKDHVMGYFVQVFIRGYTGGFDEDDGVILDIDQESDPSLTPEKISLIAKDYDFIIHPQDIYESRKL